ncbi:MAG: TIM barrel protein [Thermoguttaceae bacterium]|jgi:sugar phosphate isomerase/epimerase|nr:TIM barrel protein [Thermoguttaceae bacterium]
MSNANTYPKLHNATWPGVVGKGSSDGEPCLSLDEMLELTSGASVDGVKFDGFDLFLAPPHFDCSDMAAQVDMIAKHCSDYGFEVGTLVANVWAGSAMGEESARETFLNEVEQGCKAGLALREAGVRPAGCVRIDSSASVDAWAKDPGENSKIIIDTFKKACEIAADYGETLAMEGEVCWGGMHSWKHCLQVLESVDRPDVLGFQADMSHTNLFLLGVNAPENRILPEDFEWGQTDVYDIGYKVMTDALRPWLVDFHVAQNDGTVFGSGSHDKTGRHCLPKDPNGKLDIPKYAKFWLTEEGVPTEKCKFICWDGCMFPNSAMKDPKTWDDVLEAMISVRDACGWTE